MRRRPIGARNFDVVGGVSVKRAVCQKDGFKPKPLRCLRAKKALAVLCADNNASVGAPQSIGDSQGRGRRIMGLKRLKNRSDYGICDQRSRSIMD